MTSFEIGSLHAATVNNVGGDQVVNGGQNVVVGVPPEIGQAGRSVLAALAAASLPADVRAAVLGEAQELERALAGGRADRPTVARRLGRIVSALQSSGQAVAAVAGLVAPVTAIAHWLGPLGAAVLAWL